MSDIVEQSKLFFEACETGMGWDGCKAYCHPGATFSGMSRALLKLSGSLVHDYATISDDSPSPNRASRARRAATSAGIS